MAEATVTSTLFGAVLFTPGDRPDRFEKAWSTSRGSMIVDLEDAVAADRKEVARAALARWLDSGARPLVRINSVSSGIFPEDASALSRLTLQGIVIPKVESPADVEKVRSIWPGAALYPLIESPSGLANVKQIARQAGVIQLLFGALDLHASCAMSFPQPSFVDYCRIQIVLASCMAGIAAPVDTPFPGFKDSHAVAADASAAAKLGFNAKLCIHPAQIEPVNAAFRPSTEEMKWAHEVVEASKAGGAVTVSGAMVDAPVLVSAMQILARSGRLENQAEA